MASHSAALKVVQVPQLGIVADLGANWLLPRIIGRSRALGACITGETLPAPRLQEWGLVWECVEGEQLLAWAKALAAQMASVPAATIVATRRLIDGASRNSFSGTIEQERQCQEELCDTFFLPIQSRDSWTGASRFPRLRAAACAPILMARPHRIEMS